MHRNQNKKNKKMKNLNIVLERKKFLKGKIFRTIQNDLKCCGPNDKVCFIKNESKHSNPEENKNTYNSFSNISSVFGTKSVTVCSS